MLQHPDAAAASEIQACIGIHVSHPDFLDTERHHRYITMFCVKKQPLSKAHRLWASWYHHTIDYDAGKFSYGTIIEEPHTISVQRRVMLECN